MSNNSGSDFLLDSEKALIISRDWRLRWLNIRRASLKQQADALAEQRRAILAEVGEIEKELNDDLRGASKQ